MRLNAVFSDVNITTMSSPFGFGGGFGYQEEVTGLKLLGHRLYDSSTGRFITRDPIKDGRNWYVYCDSDPIGGVDPKGTFFEVAIAWSNKAIFGFEFNIGIRWNPGHEPLFFLEGDLTFGPQIGINPGAPYVKWSPEFASPTDGTPITGPGDEASIGGTPLEIEFTKGNRTPSWILSPGQVEIGAGTSLVGIDITYPEMKHWTLPVHLPAEMLPSEEKFRQYYGAPLY